MGIRACFTPVGGIAGAVSWVDATAKKGVYYRYTVRTANGSSLSYW